MLRSFFVPILIISAIGIPMLYSHHQSSMQETSPFPYDNGPFQPSSYNGVGNYGWPGTNQNSAIQNSATPPYSWATNNGGTNSQNGTYGQPANFRPNGQLNGPSNQGSLPRNNQSGIIGQSYNRNNNPNSSNQTSQRFGGAAFPSSNPHLNPRTTLPTTSGYSPAVLPPSPNQMLSNSSQTLPSTSPTQIITRQTNFAPSANLISTDSSGIVDVVRPGAATVAPGIIGAQPGSFVGPPIAAAAPDYGRAETLIFPGDANGPDLTAQPSNFVPVTDLNELFRFEMDRNWVKNRWDRVSTCPGDHGLHGLRVPLVTGTNSWDLHGSLTYFFDNTHRIQRITFRGWTGDETRLLQILMQRFRFAAQPTHWAGFYLAEQKGNTAKSGLLMQHPTVIRKDNPVQQMALILELNNPQSKLTLSEEFHSLTPAAQTQ